MIIGGGRASLPSLTPASLTYIRSITIAPVSLLEQSSTLVTALESTRIPSLSSRLKEFKTRAAEEAVTLSSLSSLLKNQDQLLEILEVPSLMEMCVRSEQYDAALELRGIVDKMQVLHGGRGRSRRAEDRDSCDESGKRHVQRAENRTLAMVEADVLKVVAAMTEQLFGQLEKEVSLTACLQIVGTLKRVVGREAEVGYELRRAFLERRGRWIDACLGDVCSGAPVEYIRGLTDVYRLQVADVLMQYRTIFFGSRGGGSSAAADVAPGNLPVNDPSFSWATARMAYYLEQVEEMLPHVTDGTSLASVLESCSYGGRALARVGCDPRGALLFGMVKDSAVRIFGEMLEVAEESFEEMIYVHRWVAIPVGKGKAGLDGDEYPSVSPPMTLVEHTPLAVYTNGVLAALNELRHCCPVEVRQRVEARFSQSIHLVEQAMDGVERPRGMDEEQVYVAARGAMREVMLPFLRDSLRRLFVVG